MKEIILVGGAAAAFALLQLAYLFGGHFEVEPDVVVALLCGSAVSSAFAGYLLGLQH